MENKNMATDWPDSDADTLVCCIHTLNLIPYIRDGALEMKRK